MDPNRRKPRKFSTLLFGNTFGRKREDEDLTNKPDLESMHTKLSRHWQKEDLKKICSDLPRLVSRVVVRRGGDNQTLWKPQLANDEDKPVETGETVLQLIKFLIGQMEEEEVAAALTKELDDAVSDSSLGEGKQHEYLENLLRIIGVDSRVYRVLKCIHQDYVLIATTNLKLSLTKETITKDVRGEEGWKIFITLADFVQIVHRRKEQSFDMPGKEHNHFEFAYTISMTFDKNMDEMTAALLKIQQLDLGENMDPEFRAIIETLFAHGNLIVS